MSGAQYLGVTLLFSCFIKVPGKCRNIVLILTPDLRQAVQFWDDLMVDKIIILYSSLQSKNKVNV